MAELIVLIGVPGSGKTTWRERRFDRYDVICLDEIRGLLCGDPGNQDMTRAAVAIQNQALAIRCQAGIRTVVDSTNVRTRVREEVLAHARHGKMLTVAVVFDTLHITSISRDGARKQPVGAAKIDRMRDQRNEGVPANGPVPGFDITVRVQDDRRQLPVVYGNVPPEYENAAWLR